MGTYIHSEAEVYDTTWGEWVSKRDDVFWQDYAMYAFLMGYQGRNDAQVPACIMAEPNGLPADHYPPEVDHDSHECGFGCCTMTDFERRFQWEFAHSHVYLPQLLAFDYDQTFENRRNYGPGDDVLPEGEGKVMTYRELLGPLYFERLEELKALDPLNYARVRVVMWLT